MKQNNRIGSKLFGVLFPTYLVLASACGGGSGGSSGNTRIDQPPALPVAGNTGGSTAATVSAAKVGSTIKQAALTLDKNLSDSKAVEMAATADSGNNGKNPAGNSTGGGPPVLPGLTTAKGGGHAGGNNGSGSHMPGNIVGTNPNPEASPPGLEDNGGNGDGAVASAGGGARAPSSAGGSANPLAGLFGSSDNAGVGADGKNALAFGAKGPGLEAMGTQDPEDYFSRIEVTENIFMIVERKYKKTTWSWATQDSINAAQSITPKAKP